MQKILKSIAKCRVERKKGENFEKIRSKKTHFHSSLLENWLNKFQFVIIIHKDNL
jgi:hypothetical protein